MPEDRHESPAPPVVHGTKELAKQEPEDWKLTSRKVRGQADSVQAEAQTHRVEVVVKHRNINKLRKALRDGGGLTAKRGVGDFCRGFTILSGQDVNLSAFDIIGLGEGDEIDLELAPIVQDVLKASLEDERDLVVMARPPWIEGKVVRPPSRCRRFWSCILPCCVRRRQRSWHRRSRSLDKVKGWITACQGAVFKLFYRRAAAKKHRDICVSYQDADRDIAKWIKNLCERRSMTLYTETPMDCVYNAKEDAQTHEVKAVVDQQPQPGLDTEEKERQDKEEGAKDAKEEQTHVDDPNEDYLKQLAADPTAVQAPVKSVEHWIEHREETIKTSRILVVVLSKDAADDAWILLDCLCAWQWGIPILPVKRPVGHNATVQAKQKKTWSRIKKQTSFLFGARLGTPDAGQGANRSDFQSGVVQGIIKSLTSGRKHKRKHLPEGMTDALKRACRQLQKDANALEKTRDSEVEETLLKDSKIKAQMKSDRLTPVSKFNAIITGKEGDVQEDEVEERDLTKAAASITYLKENEEDDLEDVADREERLRQQKSEQEQQALEYARSLQLKTALSERVYGIIVTLATKGVLDAALAERAACAIRTITHTERGCRAVFQFGGIEAILSLLKTARIVPEDDIGVGGSTDVHAGHHHFGFGHHHQHHQEALDHAEEERPGICARLFACCRRKHEEAADEEEGDEDPDASPRGDHGGHSPASGSPDDSPRKGVDAGMENVRHLSMILGGPREEPDFVEKIPEKTNSAPPPDGADLKLYIAHHCFSALRNLAAHSQDRKLEIFKYHGANSAVRSLQVFLKDKQAEASSTSCAALLRNLSEGSKGCVHALIDAKLLEVAEMGLNDKECLGSGDVRRHILAMLQNIAADLSASTHIFLDGSATKWLYMCADALDKSIGDKDHRLTRQALGAVANFSLLTAAQDLVGRTAEGGECQRTSTVDAGRRTMRETRSTAVMQKTRASRETFHGSDGEDEDVGSEGFAASKGFAASEDNSKHDSAASDKEGGSSTAGGDDKSSSGGSSDSSHGEESAGNSGEEAEAEEEKEESDHEADEKHSEEKQSEHGSWVPKSEQGSGGANSEAGAEQADVQSVPTADQELEESLERATRKVSGDVIEGILELVSVKRKARGSLDDGSYDAEVSVAASALAALSNFAQDTDVERFIGSLGGVEVVLKSMGSVSSTDFQLQAVRFFWNMTFSKSNQQRFVDNGGIEALIGMMEYFQENDISHARLQEQACGVLRNLAVGKSGRHKRRLLKDGMVRIISKTLDTFSTDVAVCTQACLALLSICEGAPPAAVQAANGGAVTSLVKVLKLTGVDFELTDIILQVLRCILVAKEALTPFAMAGGHLQSLEVLSRFFSNRTALAALQLLACCLSHLQEPDEKQNKESLKHHSTAGKDLSSSLIDSDANDREATMDADILKKQIEKLRTMPGSLMRKELLEQGIIPKIFDAMASFNKEPEVLEAAAGCFLNLVLEVRHHKKLDDKHVERKVEVGQKCNLFLRILGKIAYSEDSDQFKKEAPGLTAIVLRLLSAISSQSAAALLLQREQAGERTLEYMRIFIDNPQVQAAGCAFIANFCSAKLKIRQSMVELGSIQQVADLLKIYRGNAVVVEAACKVLKYLASADGTQKMTEKADAVHRCFDVMEHHRGNEKVMTACLGLFWTLALMEEFAAELVRHEIVQKTLNAMTECVADAEVVAAGAGLLRNLFTPTSLGQQASMQCREEGGFRILLEGLFLHSLPPVDEQQAAAIPKGRHAAVHGPPGAGGETADGALPNQRGSVHMPQRQGSMLSRQKSQLDRQGTAKLGGGKKAAAAALASAAQPQIQKPKRIVDWKATEESTSVGENVLAAFRNLSQVSEVARSLADEIHGSNEVPEVRLVLELHPNSAMLQYQGLDFLNQLLVVRRDIKPCVSGMADHILMMSNRHRKTPVSDIAELVLEAIN